MKHAFHAVRVGREDDFPRIRAGASLKHLLAVLPVRRTHDFPRIRAGASLKHAELNRQSAQHAAISPAFVRGPH